MLGGGFSRSAVSGQQGPAQRRSHRPLLAGVLASFAAQHAARVLPLIGGTVKPSLPGTATSGELLFDAAGKAVERQDWQAGDVDWRTRAATATSATLSAKVESHPARQRAIVRQSTPGTTDRRSRRAGVALCGIAEINIMNVAR